MTWQQPAQEMAWRQPLQGDGVAAASTRNGMATAHGDDGVAAASGGLPPSDHRPGKQGQRPGGAEKGHESYLMVARVGGGGCKSAGNGVRRPLCQDMAAKDQGHRCLAMTAAMGQMAATLVMPMYQCTEQGSLA